jgi:hypothetical protein
MLSPLTAAEQSDATEPRRPVKQADSTSTERLRPGRRTLAPELRIGTFHSVPVAFQ